MFIKSSILAATSILLGTATAVVGQMEEMPDTNAARFARGLPPKPPTTRTWSAKKRQASMQPAPVVVLNNYLDDLTFSGNTATIPSPYRGAKYGGNARVLSTTAFPYFDVPSPPNCLYVASSGGYSPSLASASQGAGIRPVALTCSLATFNAAVNTVIGVKGTLDGDIAFNIQIACGASATRNDLELPFVDSLKFVTVSGTQEACIDELVTSSIQLESP